MLTENTDMPQNPVNECNLLRIQVLCQKWMKIFLSFDLILRTLQRGNRTIKIYLGAADIYELCFHLNVYE